MRLAIVFLTAMLLAMAVWQAAAQDCEAARCAVQTAINTECSCDTADNHGLYVSCVAHVVKRLSRDGNPPTIPASCKGQVTRCAARSTCGKSGFVTCTFKELGVCDIANSACIAPAGAPCTTNADCVISTRCRTKSSAEHCTLLGGSPGTGTCCAACP